MSATILIPPPARSTLSREINSRINTLESQIELHATVNADKRRIFDALTLPEYMEAWLCLPCNHSNCHTTASQTGSCFRFDHFVDGMLDLTITGSYRICRRSKMCFSWRKNRAIRRPESSPETHVLIRLDGAFASSNVRVSHTGFFSKDEYSWHRGMWQMSLKKLQSLF